MSKKTRSKKAPRKVRPSKLDAVMLSACQEVTDLATSDIIRRRSVLLCEVAALEAEQNELHARIVLNREKVAKAWATLTGFNQAVAKRTAC